MATDRTKQTKKPAAVTEADELQATEANPTVDADAESSDASMDSAADASTDASENRQEAQADETAGDMVDSELDSLKQQLLRVHADFDNFRRRTRQEKEDLQLFATRKLLGDLLPVVDNFQRALATFAANDANSEIRTGLEMVHRQFLSVLEQYGVQRIEAEGKPFDPNFHEAVMQEPADGRETGIVSQELQTGYILHGRVLRPAMVKVTV